MQVTEPSSRRRQINYVFSVVFFRAVSCCSADRGHVVHRPFSPSALDVLAHFRGRRIVGDIFVLPCTRVSALLEDEVLRHFGAMAGRVGWVREGIPGTRPGDS